MREFLKIVIFLIVYVVISGNSCTDEKRKKEKHLREISASRDSLILKLQEDYPSENELFAAQKSAEQKLLDLSDYLNIFFQNDLDTTFRKQTHDLLINSFIDENVTLNLFADSEGKIQLMTLKQFLNKSLDSSFLKTIFIFDSVNVAEPFHRLNAKLFAGSLIFNQSRLIYRLNDTLRKESFETRANIYLEKKNKYFGGDTLMIWEVNLGDIE